jgi:hypothetical protein
MGIESSPLRDHVIFIEGAPRSGTTWLLTSLATHPDIAGVEAESHVFNFGVDRLFDNFEVRVPPLPRLSSWLERKELVDLVRDLCDGLLLAMREHVSAGTSPRFVVEKTPVHDKTGPRDLARKREVYPDAWYLHIVRDREAVTKSLMRAPWIADRSYETCSGMWDTSVGHIREAFGDLERYRELSYEDMRKDPGDALRPVFEWLGVSTDEEVLETIRVLSRQQFSDLGAVPPGQGGRGLAAKPRALAATARDLLRQQRDRLVSAADGEGGGGAMAFTFVRGLRERDADLLRSLTGETFEFEYSGPDEQLALRGEEARDALARLADETFTRRYFREWWVATDGLSEWWASAAGKPFTNIFLSALGGDATRVDMAICLAIEDDLIRRVVVISAGPLSGRPVVAAEAAG